MKCVITWPKQAGIENTEDLAELTNKRNYNRFFKIQNYYLEEMQKDKL